VTTFRTPYPGQKLETEKKLEDMTPEEIDAYEIAEEERLRREIELPHLYRFKRYKWARAFMENPKKEGMLCAANQISKSSTQITTCIEWATNKDLWPQLWAREPVQFWYFYPSQEVLTIEWLTKWPQFLPKGSMKDDAYYGWEEMKEKGKLLGIKFNSGVHVFFRTYSQHVKNLQAGTCDAIFCDEELPIAYYDELIFRLSASDGYFRMVFTATLGQDEWRRAMEPTDDEIAEGKEFAPNAFKQTISMYDCMYYEDGTPSPWTMAKIKERESRCSTANEVLKRIHGRFIVLGGRKYPTFDLKHHMKKEHPIPHNWHVYAAVDVGGGKDEGGESKDSHLAAIVFIAVSPDFRQGRVFFGWRGDNVTTTAGDVYEQYKKMRDEKKLQVVQKWYDWGSKDFKTISTRAGDPFEPAEKSHEIGEEVLNTLFKNDMLFIYETEELVKLGKELATLKKSTNKRIAKDDFCDALRYCVAKIPWDWSFLEGKARDASQDEKPEEVLTPLQQEIKARRAQFHEEQQQEEQRLQDEFDEWNSHYE
jgi:hypothetical protein